MECFLSVKKTNAKTKQHVWIEFSIWLEKTPEEMIMLLKKTFGDECLSKLSIKKWHKEFKDSWKSVHNGPQCSGPRTSVTEIDTNTVVSVIEDDRHLSARIGESLEHVKNVSELNTDAETQNEIFVRCVSNQ